MSNHRVLIVTGANRGIGLAICRQILSRPGLPSFTLLATSRKGEDLKIPSHGSQSKEVLYPKLDISNAERIREFRDEVVRRHGRISVLINNAGVNLDAQYGPDEVKQTLDVNYRGTLNMCQSFLPHVSPKGRIVNLSSIASSLKFYSPGIQQRFRNPSATLQDLERLAQDFEHAVVTKTEEKAGFGPPIRAYAFSKALVRALTSILARQKQNQTPLSSASINCCCPGWIATDMGALVGTSRSKPPKTPDQGAQIPLHLAFSNDEDVVGTTGKYWANDSIRSKDLGRVQEEW